MRCITVSSQPAPSRGAAAAMFVIIWDKKKQNAATQQLSGGDNEPDPTFDNPRRVLSFRRHIRSTEQEKTTNLHYCSEDL